MNKIDVIITMVILMDNKNRTIFLAIAVLFVICTGFTSLSFSYFINPSTTEADVLTSSLVSNEIEYSGELILAPGEVRNVTLTVISNNSFDSYFKVFYKGNIKVTSEDKTFDKLEPFENKKINVVINNESDEYRSFSFGISSALSGEEIVLEDVEFCI